MKKILKKLYIPVLAILSLSSCQKVDVEITTQLTPDVYPKDSLQFISTSGMVYGALRGSYAMDYSFAQSLSTDESILPARGGNWYDNKGYLVLHYHNWTKDQGGTGCWGWLSKVIGISNQTMDILGKNMPEGKSKKRMIAEIRTVRAFAYYMMMDLYGNVPIYTTYGDFEPKEKSPRTAVFTFIEEELKACLPDLNTTVDVSTYGRPTQWAAYSLLAKIYLNAEYYIGQKKYDDCIAACDKVIGSGKFAIEPLASYLQMFYPNNGPQMKEFIFAIPFDPLAAPLSGTNGMMYFARYDVPRSMQARFGIPFKPSAPRSTIPEFYAHFNDPGDIRNKQWLTGPQFMADGVTPVMVTTTKKGYDQFYTGTDGKDPYTYQVTLAPKIELRQDANTFDCGNDEIAWNMGYRNIKFYPDATSTNRNQNNDMPVFRYSDIILMKAEAILRGGAATSGHTALSLVNDLRAQRSTSAAWDKCNLDSIYTERSREFAMENWHRNDMIRFGKFEGKWGFKTDADPTRRIFPIPTYAMMLNPKLVQNPGY
jgi:starch-binding outer membrane protein, SusD/RagB family